LGYEHSALAAPTASRPASSVPVIRVFFMTSPLTDLPGRRCRPGSEMGA
jgi:hypothetical protein